MKATFNAKRGISVASCRALGELARTAAIQFASKSAARNVGELLISNFDPHEGGGDGP